METTLHFDVLEITWSICVFCVISKHRWLKMMIYSCTDSKEKREFAILFHFDVTFIFHIFYFYFNGHSNCFAHTNCPTVISLNNDFFWLENWNDLNWRGVWEGVVHLHVVQCSLPHYKPPLNRTLLHCLRSLSLSPTFFLTRMHSLDHRGQSG